MVSSSQATTASADTSDDEANTRINTEAHTGNERPHRNSLVQHEKHTKIEATVRWIEEGQSRRQSSLTFDLQFHASYNTAFFKLRSSVSTKDALLPESLPLFMFLAPETIQMLSLSTEHAQELGPDTVCLRFGLKVPPALVMPKALDSTGVVWKNKQSTDVWESLQSLARATSFDVLCRLPRRVMSEARLRSLCETVSSHQVVSTPGYADLAGLYGGKGGKVVRFEVGVKAGNRPSDELPPAYQDLEPGPPMPPVLNDKTSNKRRRGNSDTDNHRAPHKSRDDLEATVAWLVTELKEQKAKEALLMTALKDVNAKVAMLMSRHEDDTNKFKIVEIDLQDRIGGVEARQDELDEELETRVDSRIDEILDQKSDSIREELVDYIDETIPNRIQGVLEEATFAARF